MKPRQRSPAVMLSKRANVFYLEYCKVQQMGDRVVYLTATGSDLESYFNIPEKNTAFLLLGNGTSITQAAVRKLSESNVVVGFAGGGGSPPFGQIDVAFLNVESEYRPTEYMQQWARFWFDEPSRLKVAQSFCHRRIELVSHYWHNHWHINLPPDFIQQFESSIERAQNTTQLLTAEALWAKRLYASLASHHRINEFSRRNTKADPSQGKAALVNDFLDHGNYLAYGYAASALNGLGISFAFPVLHGKTRRGALVFDVADLYKDALIMPLAFAMGQKRAKNQDYRNALIKLMFDEKILDLIFTILKQEIEKSIQFKELD